MGFFDVLFGRTRLKKPKTEPFFALATAQVGLEVELGWKPSDRAGICLKPVTSGDFSQAMRELEELVRYVARDTDTRVTVEEDEYHFRWILLEDPDFEDQVNLVHLVAQELLAQGYGEQMLAAVFRFAEDGKARYLIYNYKRGNFYPFIPTDPGGAKKEGSRDNAAEIRAGALLKKELPLESDQSRWFALWGFPV